MRTCHSVLLLMDNAPGKFETFQREKVVMRLYLINVTNWKQPCDLGVIADVKKRYKFCFLKDVVSFYHLDNHNQRLLKEEASNFRREFVGVRYGIPATLPDAANYAREEWDKVTDETFKNAIIKVGLRISLDSVVTETIDNNKYLNILKSFNITATEQDIDEFGNI